MIYLLDHHEIVRKISVDGEYVDKWTSYVEQIRAVAKKCVVGLLFLSSNEERLIANILRA